MVLENIALELAARGAETTAATASRLLHFDSAHEILSAPIAEFTPAAPNIVSTLQPSLMFSKADKLAARLKEDFQSTAWSDPIKASLADTPTAVPAGRRIPLQFTATHIATRSGLAGPRLGLVNTDKYYGSWTTGSNNMFVNSLLLLTDNRPAIANILGHELTHFEQGNLIISRMAEKRGIGTSATIEEFSDLSKMHRDEMGTTPTPKFMVDVLDAKGRTKLTPAMTARADELIKSFRDYVPISQERTLLEREIDYGQKILKAGQKEARPGYAMAKWIKGNLNPPSYYAQNLPEIVLPPKAIQGHNIANLAVLDNEMPEWSQQTEESIAKQLTDMVSTRSAQVKAKQAEYFQKYLDTLHEQEARRSGAAVERALKD